jgi:hypothetical protein
MLASTSRARAACSRAAYCRRTACSWAYRPTCKAARAAARTAPQCLERHRSRLQRTGRFPRKLSRRCGLVAGATALCSALATSGPPAQSQSSDEPRYTSGGDLLLPNGFDTWVFAAAANPDRIVADRKHLFSRSKGPIVRSTPRSREADSKSAMAETALFEPEF